MADRLVAETETLPQMLKTESWESFKRKPCQERLNELVAENGLTRREAAAALGELPEMS